MITPADEQRMLDIIAHAAWVQDAGLDPDDAQLDPRPLDERGLPWWFGPDFHPTDEALVEFAKPMDPDHG